MRRVAGLTALLGLVVLSAILATPAFANLTGAVWTTTADGMKVDANLYDQKCPGNNPCVSPPLVPFLSGGPNFTSPSRWVPDGDYYFQVTDPSGKVLLSTDSVACRRFEVLTVAGKKTVIYPDTHDQGNPDEPEEANPAPHIYCNDAINDLITIALCPFLDTPNNGGVYKLWITRVKDYNPSDTGSRFGFVPSDCKTDNFKVKKLASVWGDKVDTDGSSVEHVCIILYSVTKVRGQETLTEIDRTCTDGNGEFSFSNLGIGNYAVDEDLSCTDCGSDFSDWTRISPAGPIRFSITRGDLGTKGKNPTPGEPIYVGEFVNEPIVPPVVTLAGVKFLDVDGDGLRDGTPQHNPDGEQEPPLAGWGITLEEKVDNGTWQQARYDDDSLVPPQVTGISGSYFFSGLPAGKVYRICEYKWIDLDSDGEVDYTYDALTGFDQELVKPADAGWLQTAPPTDDIQWWGVDPDDADVSVDVVDGQWVVTVGGAVPNTTTVSALVFGNKLGEICAQKDQTDGCGNPIGSVEGFEFCLYEADGVTPAQQFVDGENGWDWYEVDCASTGADGKVCWDGLLGGDYCVGEAATPGWQLDPGPEVQCDSLDNGKSLSFTFQNYAVVGGLTPGYWRNWRNHYTSEQICDLLQGTIADVGDCVVDIAAADAIFDHWDANPDDYMTILKAFLLCDQLTINLTQTPGYPNPSNGSLVPDCMVYFNGQWIKLSDVIEAALAIWANPGPYSRDYVLLIKNELGAFMTR